jgi:hypothetical protein
MVLTDFALAFLVIAFVKIDPHVNDEKPEHKPVKYIGSFILKLVLFNILPERYDKGHLNLNVVENG